MLRISKFMMNHHMQTQAQNQTSDLGMAIDDACLFVCFLNWIHRSSQLCSLLTMHIHIYMNTAISSPPLVGRASKPRPHSPTNV